MDNDIHKKIAVLEIQVRSIRELIDDHQETMRFIQKSMMDVTHRLANMSARVGVLQWLVTGLLATNLGVVGMVALFMFITQRK